MKLSIRFSILVTVMIILSVIMHQVGMKVLLPYLINSNDDLILTFGLIFVEISFFIIWFIVCEYLAKLLKCDEIIHKIFNDTDDND